MFYSVLHSAYMSIVLVLSSPEYFNCHINPRAKVINERSTSAVLTVVLHTCGVLTIIWFIIGSGSGVLGFALVYTSNRQLTCLRVASSHCRGYYLGGLWGHFPPDCCSERTTAVLRVVECRQYTAWPTVHLTVAAIWSRTRWRLAPSGDRVRSCKEKNSFAWQFYYTWISDVAGTG
jgi:hypothetical protein